MEDLTGKIVTFVHPLDSVEENGFCLRVTGEVIDGKESEIKIKAGPPDNGTFTINRMSICKKWRLHPDEKYSAKYRYSGILQKIIYNSGIFYRVVLNIGFLRRITGVEDFFTRVRTTGIDLRAHASDTGRKNKQIDEENLEAAVVQGWRRWSLKFADGSLSVIAPIRHVPATLKAECDERHIHCKPDCLPPCAQCNCGIHLIYDPPGIDEVVNQKFGLAIHEELLSTDHLLLDLWFYCEALGKTVKGAIGARAEEMRPLYWIKPHFQRITAEDQAWEMNFPRDFWNMIDENLKGLFGSHLQMLDFDYEAIESGALKRGGVFPPETQEKEGED